MMKKYGVPAIVVLLLMTALTANAIEVNPSILSIEGKSGEFKLQTIEIYNDEEEATIVNISVIGISNYYLQKTTYNLKPYERKSITFGITVDGSANGIIQYECGDEIVTQFVYVNAEKALMIFPQNPKAGSSIAIISTSSATASGLIFVSETGNQYPVTLSGLPITFVNISKNDYGSAVLMLVWDDREITYSYFNITKSNANDNHNTQDAELSIDVGNENINVGDARIVTLKLDGNGIKGNLIITKPDGNMILKETNSDGQAQITFDKAGKWVLVGNYMDKTVSKLLNVAGGDVDVDIPNNIIVGEEMEITFSEDNLDVEIDTPDGDTEEFELDGDTLEYTPVVGGKYTLKVTTEGYETTLKFTAFHKANVVIKDDFRELTFFDVIKKGNTYRLVAKDENTGEEIYDAEITINNMETIKSGRSWIPHRTGENKFTVSGDYIITSTSIHVVSGNSGSGIPLYVYILIIIIIIAIVIVAWKKGVLPVPFAKIPKLGD